MKRIAVLLLAICLSSLSFALNWQMVGARSMAMGGAGVVTASGTNAQYYNPALLGEPEWDEKTDENGFHIGLQVETPEIGNKYPLALNNGGMDEIKDLLKKGYVPLANTDIGFGVRRGNFAFSIRSLDVMSMTLMQQNDPRALADMAAFTEASFGYGFYITNGVRLGGNLKVIQGTTLEREFDITSDIGFGGVMRHAWNHKKLSADWGIDLGAAINLSELFNGNVLFNPNIGFIVKNLNTPKFKRPEKPTTATYWNTDKYKLKPQYRIGASIQPIADRVTIAADLDLNKNDTSVKDYQSRQLSAGLEVIVWNDHTLKVPLRVGMNKNLAEDKAPTYITAGFGTLGHDFDFELGLAVGDRTVKVKNHDWPNAMGLSMSFAWYF